MPAELNPKVETLFCEAIEINDSTERRVFLDRACSSDDVLREQVSRLVDDHFRAGGFLNSRAPGISDTMALPTLEKAGSRIGNYKLLEQIGEGGMGIVFMAEQTAPVRRRVALKIIKPGMDTRHVVARFEAERQALALMDHPNIARVFDGGTTEQGRPFFVMELVRGMPITSYCDRERLSIPERLELFVQVCRAVQHAHQKGIIHRDLKPSNVLVTLVDGAAVPKVIDFGVAKATGGTLTERTLITGFHQFIGTPLYMSPEQADLAGVDVDTRSDVYSLGVLLYELLTGTTPIEQALLSKAAFDEIWRIVREEEPPRPSARFSTLGVEQQSTASGNRRTEPRELSMQMRHELDWIVMKALEKDRRRRYESASAFAEDVSRYLADETVQACPPSRRYQLAKYARRHRAALVTGAVVCSALLLGLGLSIWQAVRATRAEQDKGVALQQARRAVDEMYTEVAEKWLAEQGKLTAVQRQFLEKALAFYQSFSAESAAEPDVQYATVRALHRVAAIQQRLGNTVEAEKSFQQMADASANYVSQHAERPEFRIELLLARSELAKVYRSVGRESEVDKQIDKAYSEVTPLAAVKLQIPAYRQRLATALNLLSRELSQTGRLQDSDLVNELALRTWQSLVDEYTGDFDYRFGLANAYSTIAIRHMWWGSKDEKAESNYRQSDTLFTKLLEERPGDAKCRRALGVSLTNLANVLTWKDRNDEAVPIERRALAVVESLAKEFPDNLDDQTCLSHCLRNLARTLDKSERGEAGEVEALCLRGHFVNERLVDQFPQLLSPKLLFLTSMKEMADHLYQSGKHDELGAFYRRNEPKLSEFAVATEFGAIPDLVARNLQCWAAFLLEQGDPAEASQVLGKYPASLSEFKSEYPHKVPDNSSLGERRARYYEGQTYLQLMQAALLDQCANLAEKNVVLSPPQWSTITESCLARAKSFRGEGNRSIDAWVQLIVTDYHAGNIAISGERMLERRQQDSVNKTMPTIMRNAYANIDSLMFQRLTQLAADRFKDSPSQKFISQLLSTAPAELRNIDLAMKSARQSIELQPENKECWNALSWALFRTGRWQECLDSLAKGDEEGTQSIRVMALWQLGRHDEARVLFEGDQKRLQEFKAKVAEALTRNVNYFPLPETFTRLYKEAAAMLQTGTDDSAPRPASTAEM